MVPIYLAALFLLLLMRSEPAVQYAAEGLSSWFEHMIPALFSCIVWSNIMIETESTTYFTRWFKPLLHRILGLSEYGAFVFLVGFTGGFPLGAKLSADLLKRGQISFEEAEFLLSFCNNLGPVYLLGFLFPLLGISKPGPCLALLYGIPVLYGLFRYHFVYKGIPFAAPIRAGALKKQKNADFPVALDTALHSSIGSIVMLGAYMIFFQTCRLFYDHAPVRLRTFLTLLTEINSGISHLHDTGGMKAGHALIFCCVTLGGLCCLAQTDHVLQESGLSMQKYVLHKLIQAFLVFCAFFVCQNVLHILP